MVSFLDIEEIVPVDFVIGNSAIRPKLVLKLIRRITDSDRFKMELERVQTQLKPPALI